jgi:hypothetical protein
MYEKSYVKYITYINSTIKELEDLQISKQELTFNSTSINDQNWYCNNLDYAIGIQIIIHKRSGIGYLHLNHVVVMLILMKTINH